MATAQQTNGDDNSVPFVCVAGKTYALAVCGVHFMYTPCGHHITNNIARRFFSAANSKSEQQRAFKN